MISIPSRNSLTKTSKSWFSNYYYSNNNNYEYKYKSILPSLEENESSSIKTIKIVLKPNLQQKQKLFDNMKLWSWYYNASVYLLFNNKENLKKIINNNKTSFMNTRKVFEHYNYSKNNNEHSYTYTGDEKSLPIPQGRNGDEIHNRLWRGAVKYFTDSLQSNLSRLKGKIDNVVYEYKSSKKNNKNLLHYEDKNYPSWIREINGYYKNSKNKKISFETIRKNTQNRSITIKYDSLKKKFILYYPITKTLTETQGNVLYNNPTFINSNKKKIIAIDPGIRTFCTCYSGDGSILEVNKENDLLYKYNGKILELQKIENYKTNKNVMTKILKLYRRIQNLVNDLHYKTISSLNNFSEIVLYPEFRVKSMMTRNNFSDSVKRVMSSLSFYKFKQRLKNKLDDRVIIVSEKLSSKTCFNCKHVKEDLGCNSFYKCEECKSEISRDWNGSVNILLMNTKVAKVKKATKDTSDP
jgi:transposase